MDTGRRICHPQAYRKKALIAVSREAVQTAEDARAIAVKKIDEERLANERQMLPMPRRKLRRRPTMQPA